MRLITYNIWVSDENFDKRLELLCKVLKECDGDVIALQEVRDESVVNYIKAECGFKYSLWRRYYDEDEGLAVLSRYPIIHEETNWEEGRDVHNSFVLRTVVNCNGMKIGITNIHLDYESALNKEIEIVEAVKLIEKYKDSEYEVLLGDFNSYEESSVYRYLTGQQSLMNHAANWVDLAKSYACTIGTSPKVTLDFNNNPRWDKENAIEVPARFDWIMLKYPYPKENPKLKFTDIIGDKREDNITPSDHYGVICDIDFRHLQK